MAGYRLTKVVKVIDTFEIESGVKLFADYLDFTFENAKGTVVTLDGKFISGGITEGDDVILVVTTDKEVTTSVYEPTDEELMSKWFFVAKCTATGEGAEVKVTFLLEEFEYDFFSFAFYKQGSASFTKTGETPVE